MKKLTAIGLVLVIVVLALKLVTAPLYAVYDDADCKAAYARAHTLADSARVSLHPAKPTSGKRNGHRCGGVLPRRTPDSTDVIARIAPRREP